MRAHISIACALALTLPGFARAESASGLSAAPSPTPLQTSLVPAGPVRYRWDPVVDTSLTAAAGIAWLSLSYLVEPNLPVDYRSPVVVNGLDHLALGRWDPFQARMSDLLLTGTAGTGLLLTGLQGGSSLRENLPAVGMLMESLTLTQALTSTLKHSVDRPRPFTLILDPPVEIQEAVADSNAFLSFPSGHTSMTASLAFTTATILADRGVKPFPVYLGASLLTGSVAMLRVGAGKHYPSDVLVGASIGTAIGLSVPVLHRVRPRDLPPPILQPTGLFTQPAQQGEPAKVGATFTW